MTTPANPITASAVMQLRERTGAGMMDCKKFLTEAQGNIEEAIIAMRKAGQAKADKKADRIAAEGAIVIALSADKKSATILEINCETDFVARDEHFMTFAQAAAKTALSEKIDTTEKLAEAQLSETDASVEYARQELVAKIGENIQLRRIQLVQVESDGIIGSYLHGSKIGVLVCLKNGDEELAKNLAMHIAASKPLVVQKDEVSQKDIDNERDIFTAQAKESGKPQAIIDKMIEGRIEKFLQEVSLVGQPFVKNPDIKIEQLLKQHNAEVRSFLRFEVGEGIEKKEDNFVQEVMAQVRSNE